MINRSLCYKWQKESSIEREWGNVICLEWENCLLELLNIVELLKIGSSKQGVVCLTLIPGHNRSYTIIIQANWFIPFAGSKVLTFFSIDGGVTNIQPLGTIDRDNCADLSKSQLNVDKQIANTGQFKYLLVSCLLLLGGHYGQLELFESLVIKSISSVL